MALKKACNIADNISNTGSECDDALLATAMIIMVPKNATWTDSDLLDFTAFLQTKIHAAAASRWFPIFGTRAPIRSITDSPEADVIETMQDGSKAFIRYGMFSRVFATDKGGMCLANHLMRFPKNYSFIEVDITNQVAMMQNSDGTYSGFPVNIAYGQMPDLSNFQTTYKNKFMLGYSPSDYIRKGIVFSSDETETIVDTVGLLDSKVTKGVQTQTITNIFIGAETICGETDLVDLYTGTGAGKIGQIANFIVTKVSDGTVVTPTAVAIVAGEVRLTGTYTSTASYYVAFAAPSVLKANGIEGYEGTVKATVPIP